MIQKPNFILIGGSRRNVGKTLFACLLIEREARLRDVIGVKITVIDPDDAHQSGQAEIEGYRIIDGKYRVIEETTPSDETDTGRMLEAGARRVFWLKVRRGHLREGIESLMTLIPDDACVVAEGTSARTALEPGVFVVIQTKSETAIKPSCAAVLPLADRVAVRHGREWDLSPGGCLFIGNEWMLRPRAGALILAGGDSRRMGRDKALLPIDGRPMIASIADQLKPLFEEIVISADRPDAYAFLGLPVVADAEPGQGPLMGIASGLPHMTQDLDFVTACDIPRIDLSFVNGLIKLAVGFDIVLPYYDEGQYEPLFAVYRKTVVPEAARILAAGGRSILDLLERVKVNLIKIPDRRLIRNVNTEEDYADLVADAPEKK